MRGEVLLMAHLGLLFGPTIFSGTVLIFENSCIRGHTFYITDVICRCN